ncbi:MAG: hypothetical protein ABNH53_11145 [Henriciella sp.]|jgi:hypothetical protein
MSIDPETPEVETPEPPRGLIGRARHGIKWLNANKKRFFWWWVGYQAIKGMLTLSLIWIPLLLIWLRSRGEA